MSILILLVVLVRAVSSALLGPEIVIAERGSSVNITCHYAISPVNIHGRKFWCKISGTLTGCSTIISSTPYLATAGYKDRTRLVDSPANGTFQVEMARLRREDGGQYRCGIGQSNDGFFSSVFLGISEGPNMTDHLELVSGELHGSISIRCRFPESQNKKTYWCKMRKTGACRILADTEGYVEKRYMGRLLVIPEDTGDVVKILTNQLTPEDAGWYRCGTGTFRSGGRWKDVQVVVSTDTNVTERVKALRSVPGGSVSTECHYDAQVNYEHKYWCKWRGTGCTRLVNDAGFVDDAFRGRISLLSEQQTNGTYTLRLTDLRAEDAGWYWCVAISGRSILTSSMELRISKVSTTASVLGSQMTETSPFPSPISMEEKRSPYYGTTIGTTDIGATQGSSFMVPASNLPLRFASTPQDYVSDGTMSSLFEVSRGSTIEGITQMSTTASVLGSQMTATSQFPSPVIMEEKHSLYYGTTIGSTDIGATQESTMRLSTPPTDGTRARVSPLDNRGISQAQPSKRSFTRNSDDPERGVSDSHLIESSNYTNSKEGSLNNKPNLLLILVPSLLLGLVLIAVGFFVITKARCIKHRVRQPVNENRTQVTLEETRCLQKSAGEGSPNLTGEKETDVDHEEVSDDLMEKVSLDTYMEAAAGVDL
ncbi:polymeric immunoglobulin receptor-like isoform X3 [Lissotriton helveticus]